MSLDQFYTSPAVAKYCFDKLKLNIDIDKYDFIEPSAGSGSFSSLIPCTAFDLDPKALNIFKQDFLTLNLKAGKYCFFGNPPFGKNSSLAVKFFNKSALYGEVVAFILPRTFRKTSIHDKLDLNFRLIFDEDLPKNSFIYEGKPYDVPCCFQIWIKGFPKRKKSKALISRHFTFTDRPNADIIIRRVGGRSGKAFKVVGAISKESNYFIKFNKRISINKAISAINAIDFQDIVNSTAGVRSLSKSELISKVDKALDKIK